jgi:hypothetical protein
MSLVVCAYRAGPSGEMTGWLDLELPPPRSDVFGVEVCRDKLWGARVVRELGCEVLPSLAEGDIFAADEDVDRLDGEARLLMAHLPEIESATGYLADYVQYRLENLLAVIALVRAEPPGSAGVYIG